MADNKASKAVKENKKRKFIEKPILAIIFLVLSIVFLIFKIGYTECSYDGVGVVTPGYINEYAESPSGMQAFNDSDTTIWVNDEEGDLYYYLESRSELETTHYTDVCFDENDHLYVVSSVDDSEAYLTKYDMISEYDEAGDFVKYIVRFDYSNSENPPYRTSRIDGLNITGSTVRYAYLDFDGSLKMYSCDTNTLITECEGAFYPEGYLKVVQAESLANGNYAVLLNNGSIGVVTPQGDYELWAECDFDFNDKYNAYLPKHIYTVDNDIYATGNLVENSVYRVFKDNIIFILNVDDLYDNNSWGTTIDNVTKKDGNLAIVMYNSMVVINDDWALVDYYYPEFDIGVGTAIYDFFGSIAIYACIACFVIGIVLLTGALSRWKLTLLVKQLYTTIPLIILLVVIIVSTVIFLMKLNYEESVTKEMVAINELICDDIDGDDIAAISDMSAVDDGTIQYYCDFLRHKLDGNKNYWSKNYDAYLSLFDTERCMYIDIAANRDYMLPYSEFSFETMENSECGSYDELMESRLVGESNSYLSYLADGAETSFMLVDTPIYDSKGNLVAYLELSTDMASFDKVVNDMVFDVVAIAVVFVIIIGLIFVLISYINIRHLNKLSNVMTDISEGDFKVRIDKIPHDEVGDICVSVNQMAEQLDDYFSTMDRNEKFYYKFVPEKFKELLHKEEFTDLALGDAESADLTVLFCDIRAFSLNSEMMTAKENFEFVNIVYGIAGPIIRKHNGFIDKYIGDAIMALFEKADDAIAAGREMYKEIVLNPATAQQLKVSAINIGIGIHSGMARIGIVGEDERMSGTVISNTVNLSSRLESLTKKYAAAMLISKDTLDRLDNPDSLNTRYLGMIQVAGVNEVKAVYEVLDCLGEKDEAFKTGQKRQLKEAIRLFHMGEREQSLEMMKELKADKDKVKANDPALDMYVDYIEEGIKNGDTDTKIFKFSRK